MRKFLKLIPALISISSMSIVVSCNITSKFVQKNIYIIEKNESNNMANKSLFTSGNFSYKKTNHEALVSNYLLRYKFSGYSLYDNLNKYYTGISIKSLSFGLINKIIINTQTNKITYDNDTFDLEINRDLRAGYKDYIYTATSSDPKSINHPSFLENLLKAKTIKMIVKTKNYYDSSGNVTNIKVSGKDLLNSIMYAKLNSNQKLSLSLSGINPNSLLNINNYLDNEINFTDLNITNYAGFLHEIIYNNIFSFFNTKSTNLNKNSTINDILYAGDYVLTTNSLSLREYNSINTNNMIKKVIIKYNQAGTIDEQTNRIHLLNAYEQGLITSAKLATFDDYQQQNIINEANKDKNKYKLSIIQPNSNNMQKQILMFNMNPNFKSAKFNENYARLIYGENYLNAIDYESYFNGRSLSFRNNFTQLINKFTISYSILKTQSYDNFIDPNAKITNAKNTTYVKVTNAYDHITKSIILNYHIDRSAKVSKMLISDPNNVNKNYYVYSESDKKKYFSLDSFKNIYNQFKSTNFQQNVLNIKNILDDFYNSNNIDLSETVAWEYPIIIEKDNDNIKQTFKIVEEIINNIDRRIKFKIVYIKPDELKNNYMVNFNNLIANNTIEYLSRMLLQNNNNLLVNLIYLNNDFFPSLSKLKKYLFEKLNLSADDIDKLKEYIKAKKSNSLINFLSKLKQIENIEDTIKSIVFDFHNNNDYYAIINVINDIKNSYAAPYRFDQIINLKIFNYELVQPWITKPTRDDGLVYFSDIRIS